jgi:hypothetical protein
MGLTYGIGYKIEISDDFSLLVDTQGFSGLTNIQSSGTARRVNANSTINIGGVFHFN